MYKRYHIFFLRGDNDCIDCLDAYAENIEGAFRIAKLQMEDHCYLIKDIIGITKVNFYE